MTRKSVTSVLASKTKENVMALLRNFWCKRWRRNNGSHECLRSIARYGVISESLYVVLNLISTHKCVHNEKYKENGTLMKV
jgi:hypothetical protein